MPCRNHAQSTQMILKMRENTLARLTKGQPLSDMEMLDDLQREIGCLRQQMTHSPAELMFVTQNLELHGMCVRVC